jgi:hypothetical protein
LQEVALAGEGPVEEAQAGVLEAEVQGDKEAQ